MAAATDSALGEVLGGYRLDRVIARGRTGCVYAGSHLLHGREAALTVLDESRSFNKDAVFRFLAGARAVAEIQHPALVNITDFITTESPRRTAFVTEYVKGMSLGVLLARKAIALSDALHVGFQLIDVLRAVHRAGIIHGDLNPSDIIVVGSPDSLEAAFPRIKVVDFCIAQTGRGEDAPQHGARSGFLMDTAAYSAPEQIACESITQATDVYALCEILFEMITGRRAFEGESKAILRAKLSDKPPVLRLPTQLRTRHARKLTSILRAGMSPAQNERPTLGEIDDALRAWMQDVIPQPLWSRVSSPGTDRDGQTQGTRLLLGSGSAATRPPVASDHGLPKLSYTKLLVSGGVATVAGILAAFALLNFTEATGPSAVTVSTASRPTRPAEPATYAEHSGVAARLSGGLSTNSSASEATADRRALNHGGAEGRAETVIAPARGRPFPGP